MSQQQELIHILQQGQAKSTIVEAINWVGTNPSRFKLMIELLASSWDYELRTRAAWALSYIGSDHPLLLVYHWDTFANLLVNKNTPNPIKRNLVRFIQAVQIPQKYHGKITDRCFELVNDPNEEIAIRAFSLTILSHMVKVYPELANELKLSIHELLPHASAGLKNRAQKVLKELTAKKFN